MMNAVGGTTVHYDGLSIRFLPWNFRSRSATIERYGPGAVPERSTVADWPFSYDELEPFYDLVEWELGVGGADGNPFAGARTRGFPMAPMRTTGWGELVAGAASRLGWHPFRRPPRSTPSRSTGAAPARTAGSARTTSATRARRRPPISRVIARAEATGPLRIETGARVLHIETDDQGLARGVRFVRDGRDVLPAGEGRPRRDVRLRELAPAAALDVRRRTRAASATTAARSAGTGWRTSSPSRYGRFPGRRLNLFNGNGSQVTCIDDFNADNFDHAGEAFIGGGMITNTHELAPLMFARGTPHPPYIPRWGSALEGVDEGERAVRRLRLRAVRRAALRGQRARPRPGRHGPARGAGRPDHPPHPPQRAARRCAFLARQAA